jgi:hypothetical protein
MDKRTILAGVLSFVIIMVFWGAQALFFPQQRNAASAPAGAALE